MNNKCYIGENVDVPSWGNGRGIHGDVEHMSSNVFTDGNSKLFITSDTHFFHKNILVYEKDNRPFSSIDEMNDEMVSRWNDVVGENDYVLHLGDFAFTGLERMKDIVSKLNGKIILLIGNHDNVKRCKLPELGFYRVIEKPFVLDEKFIMSHEPLIDVPDGMVNIFGHVHGHKSFLTESENAYCVCVERHNCRPINWIDDVRSRFI